MFIWILKFDAQKGNAMNGACTTIAVQCSWFDA